MRRSQTSTTSHNMGGQTSQMSASSAVTHAWERWDGCQHNLAPANNVNTATHTTAGPDGACAQMEGATAAKACRAVAAHSTNPAPCAADTAWKASTLPSSSGATLQMCHTTNSVAANALARASSCTCTQASQNCVESCGKRTGLMQSRAPAQAASSFKFSKRSL